MPFPSPAGAFRTPTRAAVSGGVSRFVGELLFDVRSRKVEQFVEGVFRWVEMLATQENMTQKRSYFLAHAFGARVTCKHDFC